MVCADNNFITIRSKDECFKAALELNSKFDRKFLMFSGTSGQGIVNKFPRGCFEYYDEDLGDRVMLVIFNNKGVARRNKYAKPICYWN